MHTQILIDCEDPAELLIHLSFITKQVKAAFKADPAARGFIAQDNNCYGQHTVQVMDEPPGQAYRSTGEHVTLPDYLTGLC